MLCMSNTRNVFLNFQHINMGCTDLFYAVGFFLQCASVTCVAQQDAVEGGILHKGSCTGQHCAEWSRRATEQNSVATVGTGCSRLGIGILSTSANLHRRMVVRESWFKLLNTAPGTGIVAKFFVARPSSETDQLRILHEADHFGDIVFVDSVEGYHRILQQTYAVHSVYSGANCAYSMKTDDDVYIRILELNKHLEQKARAAAHNPLLDLEVEGHIEMGARPLRSGRYKVTEKQWPAARGNYPPFPGGVISMVTQALGKMIVQEVRNRPKEFVLFPLEDVGMGLWLDTLRKVDKKPVKLIKNFRFSMFKVCSNTAFNVLLERGTPMFIDPNATMRVLLAHDRIELDQGSNPTPFCPHHITNAGLPSVAERAALEATWTKTYKSLDDAFAARREKLYELWDAAWERRRSDNSGVSVCNSDVADCSESSIGHSSTESYTQRTHSEADMEGKAQEDKCIEAQCEGRLIDVYWPNDKAWYQAKVLWFDTKRNVHAISYTDDSFIEKILLSKKQWRMAKPLEKESAPDDATDVVRSSVPTTGQEKNPTTTTPPPALNAECVGARIEVFWADDNVWYEAEIHWYDSIRDMHLLKYVVDGQFEKVHLSNETFRFLAAGESGHPPKNASSSTLQQPVASSTASKMAPVSNTLSSANGRSEQIVIYTHPEMEKWHYFVGREGIVHDCPVHCRLSVQEADLRVAHAALFVADIEYYAKKEAILPPKPVENTKDIQYYVVFREYLKLFPATWWNKYDGRITYHVNKSVLPHGYAVPHSITASQTTPGFHERSQLATALAGFVSLRCGTAGGTCGRSNRTRDINQLQALGSDVVASYGQCAHNTEWPEGMARRRDKNYVMQRHKFCFAIENNIDEDYVTEKVWDCIASGAVPIYRGAPNVAEYMPFGKESIILMNDFSSLGELVDYMRVVASNETLWNSYRKHITTPPHQRWYDFMDVVDKKRTACNLCMHLHARSYNSSVPSRTESNESIEHTNSNDSYDNKGSSGKPKRAVDSHVHDTDVKPTEAVPSTPTPPTQAVPRAVAPASDMRSWTIGSVGEWLAANGFANMVGTFADNYVDGKLLVALDEEMLRDDLGMASKLHRTRLLLEVANQHRAERAKYTST
eukprot:m.968416 g.968416  ORF g.968416 m.968416 type:complete len:1112 (+) comp23917_c0_seq8:89-3424(+)